MLLLTFGAMAGAVASWRFLPPVVVPLMVLGCLGAWAQGMSDGSELTEIAVFAIAVSVSVQVGYALGIALQWVSGRADERAVG